MSYIPRRRLSELFTLYNIDDRICDVFVEGPADRVLVGKILLGHLPFGSTIWAASDIELDIGNVSSNGGARGRVLTVVEEARKRECARVTCVVDRDLDQIVIAHSHDDLHITHFTSLDFHVLSVARIASVVESSYLLAFDASDISSCVEISKILYAIRQIAKRDGIAGGFPQIRKVIEYSSEGAKIDLNSLLSRMDSKNSGGGEWRKRHDDVLSLRQTLQGRDEEVISFHDLETVIGCLMHEKHNIKQQSLDTDWLGKLLRAQVDLPEDPFFFALRERASSLLNTR